ncbi:MAG: antibiotic biosynthesis monooxygenase [Chloroflexi bacterium]|nr:antibiotic biosynthesis monooxygenase [Chloroflexota bacterium]MBI3732928.1 antibiotic biosynthesis monooxygenase [Chloroflexota bacterium]
MYITTNRIAVSKGFEQAFEERFTGRPSHMPGVPGFIRNYLLRPADGNSPYVVMTLWESQAAFEAWTHSESFMKSHSGPRAPEGMYAAPNVFEAFEVVQTVGG